MSISAISDIASTVSNVSDLFQGVTQSSSAAPRSEKDEKKVESGDFEEFMRAILGEDPAKETNEEELFSTLIGQRLSTNVDSEAADAYASKLAEMTAKHTRANGYVSLEDAANEALASLVTDGTIDEAMASTIRNEAFAAAQLDDNTEMLYDGRGSENDPTIAVASMEAALISARQIIDRIESGEIDAEAPAPEVAADSTLATGESDKVTPEGNAIDGDKSGFLFKPISESTGNLVVLLPAQMAQEVEKLLLRDKDGNEIEQGVSSGFHNPDAYGEREHFRFTKPGGSYPGAITVEVVMRDGSTKQYQIPDPSQRYD